MEHRIQVLSVKTNLKDKTIILKCSSDIDEDTVTPDSVCLALPSSAKMIPITLSCDRRSIIVSVIPEIQVGADYRLATTTDIEDVVGDKLEPLKALKVVFESAVTTSVKIISPITFEAIEQGQEVNIAWQEEGKPEDFCYKYELQIATDSGFFNIVLHNMIECEPTIPPSFSTILPAEQYYVRIRAVKDDDYGQWSKAVTFTVPKEKPAPVPNPQPEPKPRPGIPEIVDYTKDDTPVVFTPEEETPTETIIANLVSDTRVNCDELPQTFEFVFDGAINIDQATVTIKRRDS